MFNNIIMNKSTSAAVSLLCMIIIYNNQFLIEFIIYPISSSYSIISCLSLVFGVASEWIEHQNFVFAALVPSGLLMCL